MPLIMSLFMAFFILLGSCDQGTKPVNDVLGDADSDADVDIIEQNNLNNFIYPVSLDLTEVDRFVITQDLGHLAFPDVAPLADGRLLLVYRQGDSHVDATGRLMKQFGTTDGTIWSTPEVLLDVPGIDDRDPSITRLSNGRLQVTWFQYRGQSMGLDTVYLHETFRSESLDEGETWSDPVQMTPGTMNLATGAGLNAEGRWVDADGALVVVHASSAPMVEHGNDWILPNYGGNALNLNNIANCLRSQISLFFSHDMGQTWEERPVLPDAVPSVWLQEPSLLITRSGRQLLHVRTAYGTTPSTPGDMAQSVSLDDGATWSSWQPFPFVGHAPDLFQTSHGALLSAFREINDAFTQEWVSLISSTDDGNTWTAPLRIADCGAIECGYPSFAELDSTHLLVVFYGPGGTTIEGVIYEMQPVYEAR
ncbi:glycoside hydrolase [Myxococcota bacterium]|nr:glycoside hydrolase [Myxococcota bacterium]